MNVDVKLVRQWIHDFSNKTMPISGIVTLIKIGKLEADAVQLDKLDDKTNELINSLNDARTQLLNHIQAEDDNDKAVYELTYISEMNKAMCTGTALETIENIQLYSEVNNRRENISGFLYCWDGYFLQRLEGRKDTILKMMGKIAVDPRHKNISVLSSGEIKNANYKRWDSMHCAVPMDEDMQSNISQLISMTRDNQDSDRSLSLLNLICEQASYRDVL